MQYINWNECTHAAMHWRCTAYTTKQYVASKTAGRSRPSCYQQSSSLPIAEKRLGRFSFASLARGVGLYLDERNLAGAVHQARGAAEDFVVERLFAAGLGGPVTAASPTASPAASPTTSNRRLGRVSAHGSVVRGELRLVLDLAMVLEERQPPPRFGARYRAAARCDCTSKNWGFWLSRQRASAQVNFVPKTPEIQKSLQ